MLRHLCCSSWATTHVKSFVSAFKEHLLYLFNAITTSCRLGAMIDCQSQVSVYLHIRHVQAESIRVQLPVGTGCSGRYNRGSEQQPLTERQRDCIRLPGASSTFSSFFSCCSWPWPHLTVDKQGCVSQ